ncbi:MAG: DUF4394 domain-containing protein [Pyrinomonadaceae bacterium]
MNYPKLSTPQLFLVAFVSILMLAFVLFVPNSNAQSETSVVSAKKARIEADREANDFGTARPDEPFETPEPGTIIYAYDYFRDRLISFDASAPGVLLTDVPIIGLNVGEYLLGIDFRPSNGYLYGVVTKGGPGRDRVVKIDLASGELSNVHPTNTWAPLLDIFCGFEFDPDTDEIRIIGNTGTNRRVNPATSSLIATDTQLQFASGDVNAGVVPKLVHAAYDYRPASRSTLYAIDSGANALVKIGGENGQPSANSGVVTTIGSLGIDAFNFGGFDIQQGTNIGYAVLNISHLPTLARIDLNTRHAYVIGTVGDGEGLIDGVAIPLVWAPTPVVDPTPTPTPSSTTSMMRVITSSAWVGQVMEVPIEITTIGGESAIDFSVGFDSNLFTFVSASLGNGALPDSSLTIDRSISGRVGVRIRSASAFPRGSYKILKLRLMTPSVSLALKPTISFTRDPVFFATRGLDGRVFDTSYSAALVYLLSNQVAPANVSGRVTTADGRGASSVTVSMTDATGYVRAARTSSFGYYSFSGIPSGATYVVQARSGRAASTARILTVDQHVTNFNLTIN